MTDETATSTNTATAPKVPTGYIATHILRWKNGLLQQLHQNQYGSGHGVWAHVPAHDDGPDEIHPLEPTYTGTFTGTDTTPGTSTVSSTNSGVAAQQASTGATKPIIGTTDEEVAKQNALNKDVNSPNKEATAEAPIPTP